MSKTRNVGPWMVAGIVVATIFNPGLTREGAGGAGTRAEARQPAAPIRPAAHGSSDDEEIDTLDTLGESLAVDLSTAGLWRRATRSITVLRPDAKATPRQKRQAVAFLRAFFKLPLRQIDALRDAWKALDGLAVDDPALLASDGLREADGFVTRYFNQDGDKDAKADAELFAHDFERLDKAALKIALLQSVIREQQSKVDFLIATLPDPIDSYTGWQFDPMLDAIAQAVAASDYVLDRFHFPDSDKDEPSASRNTGERGRLHELEPGVVVFRKHLEYGEEEGQESRLGDRLVLLIVHENPAAGIHSRALANAIRLVIRCAPLRGPDTTVRILGPTFSGSSESLNRALGMVENRLVEGLKVRVVSGSATDPMNETTIPSGLPGGSVSFRATVHPDNVLLPSLVTQIKDAGWSSRVAVLFEANTQYGRQLWEVLSRRRNERGTPLDFIQLPFPMNVSRLRTTLEAKDPARAGLLGMPSKFRALPMEAQGNPADQIPQFNPETTATYVELALAGMLETMGRERVKTVALMATDPRDKLFLAQQIARYSPDVSIVTAESDSIYIHPDYSSFLRGALVVSTYPLYSGNQRWSYGYQGDSERRQFANGSAQGIYNAALALLNYDENGRPAVKGVEPPPPLLEYGVPGEQCAEACRPPVWISVVGRSSAWPIRAYPSGAASSYVFGVAPTAHLRPSRVFPSATFDALLVLLSFAILAGWAVQGRTRNATGDARSSMFTYDGEPGRRAYLLVSVAGVLLIQSFVWMLCLIRVSIEGGGGWAVPALLVASVGLVAACHMTARVLAPLVRQQRHAWRPDAGWGRRLSAWGAVVTVVVCAWSVLNLVLYLGGHAVREWNNVGFLARALDFGSGVCPTLPVLFLGSAVTLWGATELSRVRLGPVALADGSVHAFLEEMVYGDVRALTAPWDLLNRSILSVPSAGIAVAAVGLFATCVFVFDPFWSWLVTIEGRHFGQFVSATLLLVQVMLSLALVQFAYLWSRIKHLLELMARHDFAAAYERVPRELFPTDLFPKAPRLVDLQTIVAHWERLVRMCGPAGSFLLGMPEAALTVGATFREEMRARPDTRWSASGTWAVLLHAAAGVAGRLRTRADNATAIEVVKRAEELPAMLVAFVLRDALARLAHNLIFVIGGVVLVFCSYTFFPFQQHTQLQFLGWIYIGITFSTILVVLVQIKRNEIVARFTSTTAGSRSTWDSAFVMKVTVFALLPLLALFAAQFPDIGGLLLRWLEPVQKALP